jgi:hypothetical protein
MDRSKIITEVKVKQKDEFAEANKSDKPQQQLG